MSRNIKFLLFIVCFLFIAVILSGITLAIKRGDNNSTEILLSQITTPNIIGEILIDGAVSCPGIFHFSEEDTIQSILTDAGIKTDASLNHIKIYIPYKEQKQVPQRIDINKADTWLLEALPGIGVSRAQSIVDYRNDNGNFHCIEDVILVKGFGEVTFNNIKDLITVSE